MARASGLDELEAEIASRLGHAIKRADQALTTAKNNAVRPVDLTVPQYSAMLALSFIPGASGAQLARACLVTPQTMATVLANLEQNGLIERHTSTVHERVIVTHLTREGKAVLKRADARAKRVEDRLNEEFTADEREAFADMLERAIKVLQDG